MNIAKNDLKKKVIILEKLKESYNDLRLDLCSVIDNIEEASPSLTFTQRINSKETTHSNTMNPPNSSIMQKLKHYKELIKDLRKKVESINVFDKIMIQEELIKSKELKVANLESENKTLKLIYSNQTKGLLQFKTNINLNDDLLINADKIIKLKEDIQVKKQIQSGQLVTIKAQLSQIDVIQKKICSIKENITYKIKQDFEKKKTMLIDNTANYSVNDKIKVKRGLKELIHLIETNEFQLTNDKMQYLRMIRYQKDKITQITQEINLLSNQINQFNKIKRLKEREKKKQRYYIQQLNHFQIESNKFSNQTIDANKAYCKRSDNSNSNCDMNEKLKSRNNSHSLKNNSQSARYNEDYYPQILRSNKMRIKKHKKVLEINQLMSANNQSVEYNNKMMYQNNLFQDIESLKNDLSLAIENDLFVKKKFTHFFKEQGN